MVPEQVTTVREEDKMVANKRLLTVTKAGEELGIGRTTAFRAAKDGSLPTLKIAGRRYVSRAALDALLGLSPDQDGPGRDESGRAA